jgi:hypothetical protein
VTRPVNAFFYDRIEDVPLDDIPRRQRMFLHITRVNAQIMGHPWTFERSTMEMLEREGFGTCPTTLASTQQCVDTYIQDSEKCARYRKRYRAHFPAQTSFVSITP